ncbi:MarR family winged helix-turn-helix transcriptional regulator [Micromonospora sp. HK10]|uniref:MarR family winged helix-turn-helix transcriptional regulator n=1 Tax=Micromonospora sp. HK10 TaxID=1538294 RepID=UPI000B16A7D9|nr:MarR family transcriptional regulator [Micromonospora sp. HK10]
MAQRAGGGGAPASDTADLGDLLGRELSTAVVLFHEAVAARRGLTASENKALDVLARRGPLTSGELARQLGLTPGAVTGLVDRLARAGYARRVPDAADRRKTFVVAEVERLDAELGPVFAPMRAAITDLTSGYTPAERATVAHFVRHVVAILEEQTARVAAASTDGS